MELIATALLYQLANDGASRVLFTAKRYLEWSYAPHLHVGA